jgi:predicted nuclease of predicted toxin-antitoxin system
VRVLLDEQLPRQLAQELTGHDVRTVQQQGWAGLTNGELLRRAPEEGFDVFVTADQNLQFQQNLAKSSLRVLVLVAPSNALEDLLPLVPGLLAAIPKTRASEIMRVDT